MLKRKEKIHISIFCAKQHHQQKEKIIQIFWITIWLDYEWKKKGTNFNIFGIRLIAFQTKTKNKCKFKLCISIWFILFIVYFCFCLLQCVLRDRWPMEIYLTQSVSVGIVWMQQIDSCDRNKNEKHYVPNMISLFSQGIQFTWSFLIYCELQPFRSSWPVDYWVCLHHGYHYSFCVLHTNRNMYDCHFFFRFCSKPLINLSQQCVRNVA